MEHRWGHRREINRFVQLQLRNGLKGFGRIRNVSISGAWITTKLPAQLLSYVQVGCTAVRRGRKTVARVEGLIVRIANQGFGIEWCELGHPAVLAILLARPYRSGRPTAKRRLVPVTA
jgi:hypothetical protein